MERGAIRQLLQQKWLELYEEEANISDSALGYLLEHSIEWQTWIQKKTGMELLTFCPQGAKAVTMLLDRIPNECFLVKRRQRFTV